MVLEIIEEKLVSDLYLLRNNKKSFYCFYMSDSYLVDQEWFTETVEEVFLGKKISFYFCIKGVFVLTPTVELEDLNKIKTSVANKLKKDEKHIDGLLKRYTSDCDWHTIIKLAKGELKNSKQFIKDNEHKDQKLLRKKCNEEIIRGTIDKEILPNFSEVREIRSQKTVLIVEDDRFTASYIQALIGGDCKKIIASTGYEAINQYMLESPDMVLLDIELPDMNGLEVLDKLKNIDRDVYVVMVSGHGTESNVSKAMEQDVKGFINKPFSRDKLMPHINRLADLNEEGF